MAGRWNNSIHLNQSRAMPLSEKRIADLILRYIFCQITPEERQELMDGYVNVSAANKLHFEKLTDKDYLRLKLMKMDILKEDEEPCNKEQVRSS